ncbi:MAG: lipopolysaccharide biosynthesis protein RfbH [Clostridiales bacterium]|nr:lipopolysaccharide biosynthesis protein RfbH [Clostridiales bacterium]
MFEDMNEQDARKAILSNVKEYFDRYDTNAKKWHMGDHIKCAGRVYDHNEMVNLVDSALNFWLTTKDYANLFEDKLKKFLNIKHVGLVNSGSSANLIAVAALTVEELGDRRVKRGDEVITVAAGFSTTIAPIIQYGAVPVFVDIELGTYNIDVSRLEEALSEKTKAVFVAHTLGNPFNLKAVKEFCDSNNLWLIEDNCDALGALYNMDGEYKRTGTVGDIGTSSFYPAHHITTGEGGAFYTNNPKLYKIMVSLRDWGRDCCCPGGTDNFCGKRYSGQYGELPQGYDHKYVYSHFGYNLKMTDMQAAIGAAQMDKLEDFIAKRRSNFDYLYKKLILAEDKLILPKWEDSSVPSWFGFVITARNDVLRNRIVHALESNHVQTRVLFAGNIIKHPCFDSMRQLKTGYRVVGSLENTEKTMEETFWIGIFPLIETPMLDFMAEIILNAI